VPPDEARMEAVLVSLRNADPAEMRRGNWVPAYEDLTDDFHRFERDWNVALLLVHLGRVPEARRAIAGLESMPTLTAMGNLQLDALRMLEAEILYREGDPSGALDVLRTITYEAPHGATYHALADGTRSRFLQAELEFELGDRAVAERLFRGFDESWSPWDGYHRVLAHQRLGEIAEADGRIDDALRYYGLLIDLWRDCDEDLVPLREEIRERRDRLAAS
jgi:tetratricopeptide (TPR) repeat protein